MRLVKSLRRINLFSNRYKTLKNKINSKSDVRLVILDWNSVSWALKSQFLHPMIHKKKIVRPTTKVKLQKLKRFSKMGKKNWRICKERQMITTQLFLKKNKLSKKIEDTNLQQLGNYISINSSSKTNNMAIYFILFEMIFSCNLLYLGLSWNAWNQLIIQWLWAACVS